MKIERTCLLCRKRFLAYPSHIKRGGGRYCSCKCSGVIAGSTLKKNAAAIEHLTCHACHKEFTAKSYSPKKFCSKECSYEARERIAQKTTKENLMCEFNCLKKFHEFEKKTNYIPEPHELCEEPPIGAMDAYRDLKSKWDIYVAVMGGACLNHDVSREGKYSKTLDSIGSNLSMDGI